MVFAPDLARRFCSIIGSGPEPRASARSDFGETQDPYPVVWLEILARFGSTGVSSAELRPLRRWQSV